MADESIFQDILKKFDEGATEVKVEINGEKHTYHKPIEAPICVEHYYEFLGDEGNGLHAYRCKNCINGRLIDPKKRVVKDGKIINL